MRDKRARRQPNKAQGAMRNSRVSESAMGNVKFASVRKRYIRVEAWLRIRAGGRDGCWGTIVRDTIVQLLGLRGFVCFVEQGGCKYSEARSVRTLASVYK